MFGCTLVRDRLLAKRGLVAKVIGLKRIHIEVVARFTHTHIHIAAEVDIRFVFFVGPSYRIKATTHKKGDE